MTDAERDGPPTPSTTEPDLAGLDLSQAGGAATRAGEDTRRRGWFWHWNSIVTQYAPLVGLKGVGLLNSYTVWTDRREESPHRGYAFPSQQREADFYGDDRAELITINKVLVALDLIEIRKEMVVRADEQGRRWRVPHNFYRVKDQGDGFTLGAREVLRVAELADRDKAVYRYVRRVFSPRFAPIDSDNVWHRILPEVSQTEVWQRLTARAAAEEDRASARTRAGHASRRGSEATLEQPPPKPRIGTPGDGDSAAPATPANDSSNDTTLMGDDTIVASINNGSDPAVAETNIGLTTIGATSVDPANEGGPTDVAPFNTTYDQSLLTTTTIRRDDRNESVTAAERHVLETTTEPDDIDVDTGSSDVEPGGGFNERRAPTDAPGEAAAVRAFEAANARASTPAERTLLRGLAERFDPTARTSSDGEASGWSWVAAAVYEAVEAGSAFVAPRRLREILGRWEREGYPGAATAEGKPAGAHGAVSANEHHRSTATRQQLESTGRGATGTPDVRPSPVEAIGSGPDLPLPHGHGARRTWAFAVGLLATAIDRATLAEVVAGTAIVGYRDGEVTIAVPTAGQAERLATIYRGMVARKLGEAMRRPVRVAFLVPDGAGDTPPIQPRAASVAAKATAPLPVSFMIAECGLPSGQVWSAVLTELEATGRVSRANIDAWLRPTRLLGRGEEHGAGASLIVGTPHALAQRRVAARFLADLRDAVEAVVGVALPIDIVILGEWRPIALSTAQHEQTKERA